MQATRRLVLVHIAELRPAAKDDAAPIGRQTIPIQNPFGIHKHSRLGIELGCEPVWKLFSGNDKTRTEEHTSELQSLMRISYAVSCLLTQMIKPIIETDHTD